MRYEDADYIDLVKDLKTTIDDLIEFISDKLIATSHQKRVNKLLAERIQDLERNLAKCVRLNSKIKKNSFNPDFDESKVP